MKTQNGSSKFADRSSEKPYGIGYTWADSKGRIHLGRSVGSGRDRAHAERRFFNQHRHVLVDESGNVDRLALAFVALLMVVAILAVRLVIANGEIETLKRNAAQIEAQSVRLVHNIQTNQFAREAETNAIPAVLFLTNGGLR